MTKRLTAEVREQTLAVASPGRERRVNQNYGYSEPTNPCPDRLDARKVSIGEELIFLHLVARSKAGGAGWLGQYRALRRNV